MKKKIIILGISIMILVGCGVSNDNNIGSLKPVVASASDKFEWVGQTSDTSILYKYIDEEEGKIIYMYRGTGGAGGLTGVGVAVTDINEFKRK